MFKTEILFSKNTLIIKIEGIINENNLLNLKRKMSYIVKEYNILKLVINIKKSNYINKSAFNNFLTEYKLKFNNNLIIIK